MSFFELKRQVNYTDSVHQIMQVKDPTPSDFWAHAPIHGHEQTSETD